MMHHPFRDEHEPDDKPSVLSRLSFVEQSYPGAKTIAFYRALENHAVALSRPSELLTPEHTARTTLDTALGNWIANGSFEQLFEALKPIFVAFDYGIPEPSEADIRDLKFSRDDLKILTSFTPEEQKYLPLARLIVSVTDALTEIAPPHIAKRFVDSVTEETWIRDTGFTIDDKRLLAMLSSEQVKRWIKPHNDEKIDLTDVEQRKTALNLESRMKLVELQYPGPKTAAFYDTMDKLMGSNVERPAQLLVLDHPARKSMEETVGTWIVDGSFDEALKILVPLALQFDFGFLPSADEHDSSLPMSNIGIPLTANEKQNLALARTICAVTSALIENAPKAIGDHFSKIINLQIDQRVYAAHPWLKEAMEKAEGNSNAKPSNQSDFNPRLNSFVQSTFPLIFSLISLFA